MTARQVRDEVMTLFMAGHETTAVTLSWTCYLLAQHPVGRGSPTSFVPCLAGAPPPSPIFRR